MFKEFDAGIFDSKDFKEDSVREEIIVPILKRLGYSATGENRIIRSKTLNHPFIYVGTRKLPIQLIPDYTLLCKNKPVFILDAKAPNINILDRENIQQVYSYAIHPEIKSKYFGLCNGRRIVVFDIDSDNPVLDVEFANYENNWTEIEKNMSPEYLLEPEKRNFDPDLGYKLLRMGMTSDQEISFIGARFGMVGKVDDTLYTASGVNEFGDEKHLVSFDFDRTILNEMISCLPIELQDSFISALSRNPFQACADLMIEVDVTTKLGDITEGAYEKFVPLIIHEVHGTRFDPSPDVPEPTDMPDTIYRLKNGFRLVKK